MRASCNQFKKHAFLNINFRNSTPWKCREPSSASDSSPSGGYKSAARSCGKSKGRSHQGPPSSNRSTRRCSRLGFHNSNHLCEGKFHFISSRVIILVIFLNSSTPAVLKCGQFFMFVFGRINYRYNKARRSA